MVRSRRQLADHAGEVSEGFARLKNGLAQLNRIGLRIWMSRARMAIAEACLAVDRYDEGLEEVSRAMTAVGECNLMYPGFTSCKEIYCSTPPGKTSRRRKVFFVQRGRSPAPKAHAVGP
jgi:hypothetical protein